jgi:hypothetical protein
MPFYFLMLILCTGIYHDTMHVYIFEILTVSTGLVYQYYVYYSLYTFVLVYVRLYHSSDTLSCCLISSSATQREKVIMFPPPPPPPRRLHNLNFQTKF